MVDIMQAQRIMDIARKLVRNKKYRNHIIRRLVQETQRAARPPTSTRVSEEDVKFLSSLKIGFVGGCELSFMKEFLEANSAQVYHTFDHNEPSNPFLAFSDEKSGLYSFNPSVIIVSDVQDIRNYIFDIQHGATNFTKQEEQLKQARNRIMNGINLARKKLSTVFVIMNYPLAIRPAHGRFDYKHLSNAYSLREFLRHLDLLYFEMSKQEEDIYFLSIDESFLSAGVGHQIREGDADGIYEHLTREGAVTVAKDLIGHLKVIMGYGRRIKCAVIDLDNTLWDGILRDDGVEGINLHQNRLKALELLTKRGIVLAISSKNDSTLVPLIDEILGERSKLFAIKKVNWNDKAQNLREIAQELNIGIDSLAFFDDNPYERDQIKTFLPQILVLPDTEIIHALNRLDFEPIGKLTEESSKRTMMYAQQAIRESAEKMYFDKESFLRACEMRLWMREVRPENLGRVTELILRTNQLNATAARYTNEEILDFYRSDDYKIYAVNLDDKYGEYGLIGVALVHREDFKWTMDVLTFSCRAMGKTVEQTFLTYLMNEAKKHGAKTLVGKYIKTDRNEAVEKIFEEAEFVRSLGKNEMVFWEYNFDERGIPKYPDWFEISK
ncbi:HAD-IIIC family phosphatase [Candidatus Thorarchaeota archaeon]|nr:MAG: HAD-IIIC family phosphatase [Candidatus Thorarchaeota archaeon]